MSKTEYHLDRNDAPVCPHCGYIWHDFHTDIHMENEDKLIYECPKCDGQLWVMCHIDITYDTRKTP